MSDVLCAGCGSTQQAGAPFCAVCGKAFPRTGRPVDQPADQPRGEMQRAHAPGGPARVSGPGEPVSLVHTGTTEPEMMTATQVPASARVPAAPPAAPEPRYAHVGRRVVAYLLDGVVAGLLFTVVYGVGFTTVDLPSAGGVYTPADPEFQAIFSQIALVVALASALAGAYWLAMIIWEGRTGKTLGNLIMGIRTVRADGGVPIGFGRALLRYLVLGVSGIVPVVGPVVMLLSPLWDGGGRRQGWHDKAAKAVVVDARGGSRPAAPESFAPASGGVDPAPAAPAHPVGVQPPPAPSAPAAEPAPAAPVAQQPPAAPPGVPDPYAPPVSPAAGAGGDGLITGVPGTTGGPPAAPPQQPAAPPQQPAAAPQQPAAPPQAPAPEPHAAPAPVAEPQRAPAPAMPAPEPAPAAPSDEVPEHTSFEATRMQAPTQRHEMSPAPVVAVELELESGARHTVTGPARLGRNPEASPGETVTLVRVEDPSRSVSKNHADLDVDSAGLWLSDRGSTNGTVISVAGLPPRVVEPGTRVRVPVGATIHVGDRRVVVHPGARA